ncbi:peptidase domain-containing ABC transporter [Hoeflea sp. AS60]|uniref:peptidase domain-containing ABC transporter n=1 Tax=Hoeflea sp. AS60 TaxID=3135780 RepID=UPI0031794F1B
MTTPQEKTVAPAMRRPMLRFGFPAVLQHSEMDCGAACLATIAAYWGRRLGLNRMREHVRVGREGASLANLKRAATELGFTARPMECPAAELASEPLPAIVNWKGYHWIVVYRVGRRKVTIADPALGVVHLDRAAFERDFSGFCLFLTPGAEFADLKNDKPALSTIIPHFAPLTSRIGEVLLAALAVEMLTIAVPLFTKFLLDNVIMQGQSRWLIAGIAGVSGAAIMQLLLSWVRQEIAYFVVTQADLSLVQAVFHRLVRLPINFFQARKAGDITSRMEEHEKVSNYFTAEATQIVVNVISVALYIAIMVWFSPMLAAVATSFAVLNIFVVRVISPRLRHAFGEAFEKSAALESHILDTLKGIETVKATGSSPFVRGAFDDLYAARSNTAIRIAGYAQGSSVLIGAIGQITGVAILFLGANLVFDGAMSIGVLVAFTMFSAALHEPLHGLVGAWDETQEMLNALERLDDILGKNSELQVADDGSRTLQMPRPMGHVSLRRVAFRYHPDDRANVLQNLNLDIRAGETVALVGRSGCGKSTVLRLLFGMYRQTSGRILIDGFDMRDVSLTSLRRHIGCVPQTPMIFAGSVRDNIAFACPGAGLDEIEEAARLADAADFISVMPGGMDAPLAERGGNISGGQRQRIAIARVFLQNPAILIMDEATSALDTASEDRVMKAIAERFAGRTLLMAAHRHSTVIRADRIVVLNRGLIVEQGGHEELIAAGGLYKRLHAHR